jgi:hypothetical protein
MSKLKYRLMAVADLLIMAILVIPYVLWFGLPVLWRDYPVEIKRDFKVFKTGKLGPSRGIVW